MNLTPAAFLGTLTLMMIGGCVSVPPKAGFEDVQSAVGERGGHLVQWRGRTAEDRAVDASVRALLARPLTADAAVQVALLNNRHLQAIYEELGIAQAEVVQAGLLKNPVFEFDPRWAIHDGSGFSYELTVTQDFLDILFIPLRRRIAAAQFEQAKLRVAGEVIERGTEVKRAYYRYQAARQFLEIRQTVARATDASAEAAQRLRGAGNITRLRLHQERAVHERAKIALARAEAEALDAREDLSAAMGLWGVQTAWETDGRLSDPPAQEVQARGLESLAVSRRLDLAAAERETRALATSLGMTGWSVLDFTTGLHAESEPDGTASVGPHLEGSIPLFDRGQARVAKAAAELRQAQRRYYALAVDIRSEVRRARNRLQAAREQAAHYRSVVLPLLRQITQETQLQYNAMDMGVFELLQAKQEEIEAGQEYVEHLRDYWLARVDLEQAVGGGLPGVSAPAAEASPPAAQPATAPAAPKEAPHHEHGGHQ